MNVLVTGSAGFVGHHLCPHLKKNGFNVIGLDYQMPDHSAFWPTGAFPGKEVVGEWCASLGMDGFLQYRLGSKEDDAAREGILERLQGVDYICHLASQSHVDRSLSSPRQFLDDNVNGTLELFEMARLLPNLKKIVLFSTDEVVACKEEGSASENDIFRCGSVYSASKGAQELLAQAYIKTYNLPILITRCVNIFGTHQASEKLIPSVIEKSMRGIPVTIYGDGYQTREWVHVDYVVDMVNWAMQNTYIPDGKIIHITGTKEITNLFLVRAIQGMLGKGEVEFVKDRQGHDVRYSLSAGDANLIWDMPKYEGKFVQDLEATVKWYKERL